MEGKKLVEEAVTRCFEQKQASLLGTKMCKELILLEIPFHLFLPFYVTCIASKISYCTQLP